ncbi:MAG: hypothetical protein DRJ47_02615 [Thermoprotei archaeon]|nr:MAG: hypothetical protein DRJ47_02615 [Thermoprotei archaeon]
MIEGKKVKSLAYKISHNNIFFGPGKTGQIVLLLIREVPNYNKVRGYIRGEESSKQFTTKRIVLCR